MVNPAKETEDFLVEAVEDAEMERIETLTALKKRLRDTNRAFIWDNMIKRDQDAKEVFKDVFRKNREARKEEAELTKVFVRQVLKKNIKLEKIKVKGKDQIRLRDEKTGKFVSKDKAYRKFQGT
jgi:hypothetical protein